MIVVSQGLHGLAYTFFIFVGWKFVAAVAPKDIGNSAQSLIWLATNGVGLFLGTQLAGVAMDKFSAGGKFQWSKVFAVPLLITLVGAGVLAAAVHDPEPAAAAEARGGEARGPEGAGAHTRRESGAGDAAKTRRSVRNEAFRSSSRRAPRRRRRRRSIWVFVGYYAHREVGWIAWGIGFLAGLGLRYVAYLQD